MRASRDRPSNGFFCGLPPSDVQIVTYDGRSIPAHSGVLASASPVLERMLDRSRKSSGSGRTIHILGAPHDAVFAFVQFLYSSSRCGMPSREEEAEAMQLHGMALLALSHAYRVLWLKRRCEAGVAAWVSAARAVDALKMAKLCDSPMLRQRCMKVVVQDFAAVQESEGWRFLQKHDPAMELEIIQFVQDAEQRKKQWRRDRAAQEMYRQLSEAMDCLHHICTEGCTAVGPHDRQAPASNAPCVRFSTCEGLQLLIRHFAACPRKVSCTHCKRMWQLFRLHASLCQHSADSCRVPLCRQIKEKMEEEKVDRVWRLLVKKVSTGRVMASLAKRDQVPQQVQSSQLRYQGRQRCCK